MVERSSFMYLICTSSQLLRISRAFFGFKLILHTCFLSVFSQVQIEDVENEEKRYALFLERLGDAQKWEDFQLLMLLLQAWPPMIKEEV